MTRLRPGKWALPEVPKRCWVCTGITDLGNLGAICEMCEYQPIRYVHHMKHADWEPLDTGCVCAGEMEEDLSRAKAREGALKNFIRRRELWLTRTWQISARGNDFLNTSDGFNVTVFRKDGSWSGYVKRRKVKDAAPLWLNRTCDSSDAAKLAVFDMLMSEKGFFRAAPPEPQFRYAGKLDTKAGWVRQWSGGKPALAGYMSDRFDSFLTKGLVVRA